MSYNHYLLSLLYSGAAPAKTPHDIPKLPLMKELVRYMSERTEDVRDLPGGVCQADRASELALLYNGQSLFNVRRSLANLYAVTPNITIAGADIPGDLLTFLRKTGFFVSCHRAYQTAVCIGLGIEQIVVDVDSGSLTFTPMPINCLVELKDDRYVWSFAEKANLYALRSTEKIKHTIKQNGVWEGYGVQYQGLKPFFHRAHHLISGVSIVDTQVVNQEFQYIWLSLELAYRKVYSGQLNIVAQPEKSGVFFEDVIGGYRIETPEGGNSPQILQTKPKTEAIRLLEEQLREMEVAALPFRENALSRYSEGAKSGRAIEEERRAYDVWNAQCARWCADADIEMLRYILALNQHFQWFTPIEADADIQIEYPAFQTEYDKREAQRLEEEREQKQRAYELELKRLELDRVQKDRQHELAVAEVAAERLRFLADLVQNNLLPVGLLLRELYGPDVDVEATMSLQKNTKESLDSISAPALLA